MMIIGMRYRHMVEDWNSHIGKYFIDSRKQDFQMSDVMQISL